MSNIIRNKSMISPSFDGIANGSNAVALPGDAYVDLDIVHQLEENIIDSFSFYNAGGAEYTFDTADSSSFNLGITTNSSANYRPTIKMHSTSFEASVNYLLEFDCVIHSGTPKLWNRYESEGGKLITLVNGSNKIEISNHNSVMYFYFEGLNNLFDISMTSITMKKIAIKNSYFTYTDPVIQDIKTMDSEGVLGDEMILEGSLLTQADFDSFDLTGHAPTYDEINHKAQCVSLDAYPDNFSRIGKNNIYPNGETGTQYKIQADFSNVQLQSGDTGNLYVSATNASNAESIVSDGTYSAIAYTIGNNNMHFFCGLGANTNNSTLDVTNISCKQIFNRLPTATKYRMTNDFSNAVAHDAPFSQEDLDLMKADPLTLMRVFFDGLVLPSGFAKVNIKNLYCGNEGLRGGSTVYDIANP